MYCTDNFFTEQLGNEKPVAFRRQQSYLYNKLHPDPVSDLTLHVTHVTYKTLSQSKHWFSPLYQCQKAKTQQLKVK